MKDDELAEEFHELKRRNQTPDPADRNVRCVALPRPETDRQAAPQEILRDHGCGIGVAGAQGRLTIHRRTL